MSRANKESLVKHCLGQELLFANALCNFNSTQQLVVYSGSGNEWIAFSLFTLQ